MPASAWEAIYLRLVDESGQIGTIVGDVAFLIDWSRVSHLYKLSICIPTLNRCAELEQTLRALLTLKKAADVQVVVSDNASTDATRILLESLSLEFSNLSFVRQKEKVIFDKNVSFAVASSTGKYIWVLPDDDHIDLDAIGLVLEKIEGSNTSLCLFVNFGHFNKSRPELNLDRVVEIFQDQIFEFQNLSPKLVRSLSYLGSFICPKEYWENSSDFIGSGFIHTGTALNTIAKLGRVSFIEKPLIMVKVGSRSWESSELDVLVKGWSDMSRNLDKRYFSKIQKRDIRNVTLNNLISPGWLLAQRMDGTLNLSIYISKVIRNCNIRQNFLVLTVVLIPSGLLRYVRRIKKSLGE